MITATTHIAAPPALVRSILLDFPAFNTWTHEWIKSIRCDVPGKTHGEQMVVGEAIRSEIAGMGLRQVLEVNTPHRLQWRGPWYGVLTGIHGFEFHDSDEISDGCKLVQWEEFEGLLAPFMRPGMMGGRKTREGFDGVNGDLKSEAERRAGLLKAGGK